MKTIFYLIFFSLIQISISHSNCDFERLSLGTGSEMIKSVYDTEITKDRDNYSLSSSSPKGVSGEKVCDDIEFKNLNFRFFFVDHKLHVISASDDHDSEVNYLNSLIGVYGEPTSNRFSQNKVNIIDYHWALINKDVFLQVIESNDASKTNIKIISKEYVSLIENSRNSDDVLH